MSVDEGGSYSSRMSNKSEKNMADFEGEDSACEEEEEEEEEELAQLAAKQVQVILPFFSAKANSAFRLHG